VRHTHPCTRHTHQDTYTLTLQHTYIKDAWRHSKGAYKMHELSEALRGVIQMYHPSNMGWLTLVGSLILWVSFAKEPYQRDYILQKRPMILRSLLIVATP